MTIEGVSLPSPYARAHSDLSALGWHPIPLMPADCGRDGAGKAPGEHKFGQWWGMSEWQRFRDRLPTEFERRLWAERWPGANVGLVLGARIGDAQVVALDIDAVDFDTYDAIARAAPASPMVKRGRKGETRFYRAAATLKTQQWRDAKRAMLAEFLTGQDTRQTVVPPSVHPDTGTPYVWLAGPVSPSDLPLLTTEDVASLVETLELLGGRAVSAEAPPQRAQRVADGGNYWSEVKEAALANLGAWVPELRLHGCRPARHGFEGVATWRASSTGRPLADRKRNLSIQPGGIRDFGTGEAYTAIDLVMAANSCSQEEATGWLRERLGLEDAHADAMLAAVAENAAAQKTTPAPVEAAAGVALVGVAIGGETRTDNITRAEKHKAHEAPAEVLRGAQVGLLGELIDWVLAQSRRPQPIIALGAALSILGACTARRYGGPTRSGTHLFILSLAPSGAGKDGPRNSVANALNSAGLSNRVGPGQFLSFPAIINRMARDAISVSPIDEFADFLKRINGRSASSYEQGVSGVMRQLWSASFTDYLAPEWANRAAPIVHAPHFAMFGLATHQELYAALAAGDLVNGFLNRFLLLSTHARGSDQDVADGARALPESLRAQMRAIAIDQNPYASTLHNGRSDDPPVTVRWANDGAKQMWAAFAKRCELIEGVEAAFFARSAEMAVRLATVRAVGEGLADLRITLPGIAWGIALAKWSAETMMAEAADYMAETDFQAQCKGVLRLLRDRGEMSRNQITRAMQHRLKGRDLQDVLSSLLDADDVFMRQDRPLSGGPPRQFFKAT